jgi:acyl-coenzyme A thioesterase PaaI-like protein
MDDQLGRVLGALRPEVELDGPAGRAWYRPEPEHRGVPGWLHGGMAATLLDHVCARTAARALGAPVVTGTLDLRYRRPVSLDHGPYPVEATAGRARGRMVRVTGALRDRGGFRLVEARGLFVLRPDP